MMFICSIGEMSNFDIRMIDNTGLWRGWGIHERFCRCGCREAFAEMSTSWDAYHYLKDRMNDSVARKR